MRLVFAWILRFALILILGANDAVPVPAATAADPPAAAAAPAAAVPCHEAAHSAERGLDRPADSDPADCCGGANCGCACLPHAPTLPPTASPWTRFASQGDLPAGALPYQAAPRLSPPLRPPIV